MSYTQLSRVRGIALKKYRCIWCGERIDIGSSHIRRAGVFDGDFQSDRWHIECDQAAETLSNKDWRDMDNMFEPGEFKRGTKESK